MKHLNRTLTVAIAAISIGFSIFARNNDDDRWEQSAQQRKAEYIYCEAQRQSALDNKGATYELYRRANLLDSTNTDYYVELGFNYIYMANRDMSLVNEGIDLFRKKFEADPSDVVNNYYYSQMLNNIGDSIRRIEVLHTADSLNPTRSDVAISYIDALIGSNDTAMARRALDRINRLEVANGKDMEITRRKTAIYHFFNDTASALNEIHSSIKASPLNPECYIFAGVYFNIINSPDSALAYYKKACAVAPESGGAAFELAQYYKNIGDTIGYSREIDRALLETDLDIDSKYDILLDYTRDLINDSTYLPEVNAMFNRVIEKNPQEPSIRNLYSEFLSAQNDYAGAAEQMIPVLDLQPDDSNNWIRTAVLYMQVADYAHAKEILTRALRYHDGDATVHSVLSTALYLPDDDTKDVDGAIAEMHRAYQLTDSSDIETLSERLTSIGDLYYSIENNDSANVYYRRAIDLYPANIMAKNNFAYHLSEVETNPELLAEAEALSRETITAEPDNAIYLDTYAWILFKQQDYKRAKSYIDRALDHADEETLSVDYYIHAGDIYFWNQLIDRAVEFWTTALELDPDDDLLQRKVKYKTYFKE